MAHMRSTDALDLEKRINDKRNLSLRIKIYCLVDIVYCSIFWIWALIHVFAQSFPDAGVATFLFVIISCIFGLVSVYYYHKERDDRARYFGIFHCITIVISHLLLCANYTAGIIHYNNNSVYMYIYIFYCIKYKQEQSRKRMNFGLIVSLF